jgi:hypothetical protein
MCAAGRNQRPAALAFEAEVSREENIRRPSGNQLRNGHSYR